MGMLNHNVKVFLRVTEKGSITAVADELFISQPAVSKAIKQLEAELQMKLFHRSKKSGLMLTDAGVEIQRLARQMEDLENRMYQTSFCSNNFVGCKVKVASMPTLTSVIMSQVLKRFKATYPEVTVDLVEGTSMEIRKAVEEHRVDFGLVTSPFGNLEAELVCKDGIVALSAEPLPEGSVVDLKDRPERFIFCQPGRETILEVLRAHQIDISPSLLVQQADTVLAMTAAGNGIGVLSRFVADFIPNSLHQYPVVPEISVDIGLVAPNLKDLTPLAKELRRMILEHAQTMPCKYKFNA